MDSSKGGEDTINISSHKFSNPSSGIHMNNLGPYVQSNFQNPNISLMHGTNYNYRIPRTRDLLHEHLTSKNSYGFGVPVPTTLYRKSESKPKFPTTSWKPLSNENSMFADQTRYQSKNYQD